MKMIAQPETDDSMATKVKALQEERLLEEQ